MLRSCQRSDIIRHSSQHSFTPWSAIFLSTLWHLCSPLSPKIKLETRLTDVEGFGHSIKMLLSPHHKHSMLLIGCCVKCKWELQAIWVYGFKGKGEWRQRKRSASFGCFKVSTNRYKHWYQNGILFELNTWHQTGTRSWWDTQATWAPGRPDTWQGRLCDT